MLQWFPADHNRVRYTVSDCRFIPSGFDPARQRYVYHCPVCQRDVRVRRDGATILRACKTETPIPAYGPGTEIHAMILSLGFSSVGCGGCQGAIDQMNRWGVEGCRVPANRAWIIDQLNKSAARLGWAAKLSAGVAAVRQGLPLTIPGLVDEAIARASQSVPSPLQPRA